MKTNNRETVAIKRSMFTRREFCVLRAPLVPGPCQALCLSTLTVPRGSDGQPPRVPGKTVRLRERGKVPQLESPEPGPHSGSAWLQSTCQTGLPQGH